MKRYKLVSLIFMMILLSCSSNKGKAILVELNLEEIGDSEVSLDMKEGIAEYLKQNGYKANISEKLECNYIKSLDDDYKLIHIVLDYAWLDSIVVVQKDDIKAMLPGMSTGKVFITNLNSDDTNEILYQSTIGSGIARVSFALYDLSDSSFHQYMYYDKNREGELVLEGDEISVYSLYREFDKRPEKPLGTLKYDSKGLYISGYESEL